MKRYVGVDLHTNSMTVCYFETEEKMTFKTYTLSEQDLMALRASLSAEDELAVEATGNTEFFVCAIEDVVSRVVIVNPGQFDVIRKSVSKTDKKDAKALAYFLSKDMFPACRRKSKDYQRVASLSQTRDKLVKSRTFFLNKIHGLLNGCGIKLKKETLGTEKGLARAQSYPVDVNMQFEIDLLVLQIKSLNESIKKADKKLIEIGSQLPGYENLVSIKGIGERSWAILLSAIGNIEEFKDADKLSAYFGMVPKVSSSNETTHHGRITKHGSKLGRTTLVQCTLVAIRYSDYLRQFYNRIKIRRGSGKAIIATAKKMLGIIFNTLKNNWVFEDFPHFVLVKQCV